MVLAKASYNTVIHVHTFLGWVVPVGIKPLTLATIMPCSAS